MVLVAVISYLQSGSREWIPFRSATKDIQLVALNNSSCVVLNLVILPLLRLNQMLHYTLCLSYHCDAIRYRIGSRTKFSQPFDYSN